MSSIQVMCVHRRPAVGERISLAQGIRRLNPSACVGLKAECREELRAEKEEGEASGWQTACRY